jgi:hypothetical protein
MLRFIVDWVGRIRGRSQPEEIVIAAQDRIAEWVPSNIAQQATGDPGPVADAELAPSVAPQLDALALELDDRPEPTPSQMGVRFQRTEFRKLLKAVGHWPTVEFSTAYGTPIETMRDVPRGADGGIDVVIRIVADTELGAKRIAGRIRNMVVRQAY